ncbi:MAG: DUF4886 domain-containing protein [Parapedobacter sp.]|nr:MAG: DUF4886 domain-containing protein [Parapedobacter sp.]
MCLASFAAYHADGARADSTDERVIRILAIGNSFSADAVENYLYDLAKAAGIPVVIGNLAIAGGSLANHVHNAQNDAAPYIYTKIESDGTKTTTFDQAIEPILTSERWDFISFQQVSQHSGMYSTFETTLPVLLAYVRQRATNPNIKYVLHQTWAYEQGASHSGFANYGNDQLRMYQAIVNTYNKARKLVGIDLIVPAGTAIQNGRTSVIGDRFNKDGFHLEQSYARYTVACTWFEKLLRRPVIGNAFKPSGMSDEYRDIAQHAAHFAVIQPDKVTELVDYK